MNFCAASWRLRSTAARAFSQCGLGLRHLRFAAGDQLASLGLVDADDDLALLHVVPDVVIDLDYAAGYLRGDRGLFDRLDHRLRRIGRIDVAVLDRGGAQPGLPRPVKANSTAMRFGAACY